MNLSTTLRRLIAATATATMAAGFAAAPVSFELSGTGITMMQTKAFARRSRGLDDPATHDLGDDRGRGADDAAGHERGGGGGQGADDPAGHERGGAGGNGADDPAGHDRGDDHGQGNDDGPNHG